MNKCTFYSQCNEPIARCCINHYQECEAYKRFEMAEQRRVRSFIGGQRTEPLIVNSKGLDSFADIPEREGADL